MILLQKTKDAIPFLLMACSTVKIVCQMRWNVGLQIQIYLHRLGVTSLPESPISRRQKCQIKVCHMNGILLSHKLGQSLKFRSPSIVCNYHRPRVPAFICKSVAVLLVPGFISLTMSTRDIFNSLINKKRSHTTLTLLIRSRCN